MPAYEHLVICGDAAAPDSGRAKRLDLNLHGASANVRLEIGDISRRLLANISDAHADLLEIASYIYAADSAIPRGGLTDEKLGARWRRTLRFVIPVRNPELWSSTPLIEALIQTASFLSDDNYDFDFFPLKNPQPAETYFSLSNAPDAVFAPDDVILFSGGLDSFAGTVEGLVVHGKKVALVSHRSAPKIVTAQNYLVKELRRRFGSDRILHVPVRAHLKKEFGREETHRARSFLFAALGAVTAHLMHCNRIYFFENGVVSLNLPPVGQVVGARATRTTHPQALAGFQRVLSAALGQPFYVSNPYGWMTKSEVIARIAQNDCHDLIRHTRSCTRVRSMTRIHPHCGKCSQCIDRRFAVLAVGHEKNDPEDAYDVALFLGKREAGPDREMALAFIRSASKINQMTEIEFFKHYGETSRIIGYVQEHANTVARRIFALYQRHANAVCAVFDNAIKANAPNIRQGSLPADCLLSLVVAQGKEVSSYVAPTSAPEWLIEPTREIRMAIDHDGKHVVFERWGAIKGESAKLLIALAKPFREAIDKELAPERYPFLKTSALKREINCNSDEVLRRRVLRCRNYIEKLAKATGETNPSLDAVIESSQWHGYRLNPDHVRLVAPSELAR
jgi:Queuosine biosynthesis protein QueC